MPLKSRPTQAFGLRELRAKRSKLIGTRPLVGRRADIDHYRLVRSLYAPLMPDSSRSDRFSSLASAGAATYLQNRVSGMVRAMRAFVLKKYEDRTRPKS